MKKFLGPKIKELKKIHWTKPKMLLKNIITVMLFVVFFVVVIYALDIGISFIIQNILTLFAK